MDSNNCEILNNQPQQILVAKGKANVSDCENASPVLE